MTVSTIRPQKMYACLILLCLTVVQDRHTKRTRSKHHEHCLYSVFPNNFLQQFTSGVSKTIPKM